MSSDLDYDQWRQELIELLPKRLLTHATKLRIQENNFAYNWFDTAYTASLGDIWDYRPNDKETPPLELLEKWIAYSTPLDKKETTKELFWVIDDDLQWNAVIHRGTYTLHHRVQEQDKPKPIHFKQHFTIENKGAIISITPKHPCPAPSTALSHGMEFFIKNVDPLYAYSSDMCIAFKDPYPLLFGNKDALNRLLGQGNHPYTQIYSLNGQLIKENHE